MCSFDVQFVDGTGSNQMFLFCAKAYSPGKEDGSQQNWDCVVSQHGRGQSNGSKFEDGAGHEQGEEYCAFGKLVQDW